MDKAMKGEVDMDDSNKYLYHCNGCQKPDKNYPDKEVDCDECKGNGWIVTDYDEVNGNDLEEECNFCSGYGKYTRRTKLEHHMWARSDAYGLYTGLYCEECYDDPTKYTYRKDRYYDPAYAGENMDPEA